MIGEGQVANASLKPALMNTMLAVAAIFMAAIVALIQAPHRLPLLAFLLPLLAVGYLHAKCFSDARWIWQLPLAGYGLTFFIGAGLSASNLDIRAEVELVGVGVFATMASLSLLISCRVWYRMPAEQSSSWRRSAMVGLGCNLLLLSCVSWAAHASYAAKHRLEPQGMAPTDHAEQPRQPTRNIPIWIDTDPACGSGTTKDVDDCWALLAAIRSPELTVRGISTVFGNQDGRRVSAFAQEVLSQFIGRPGEGVGSLQIVPGSPTKSNSEWPPSPASRALASALERERLTIIALGPLTNIATLIKHRPDLTTRIERIVFVGGKRPGQLFHPGHQWWFHFGDFNVSHDPDAAEVVLYSGAPITLVPFELATKVTVGLSDLDRLRAGDGAARWLSDVSQPWLSFWRGLLRKRGFHPFDVLAVAYLAMPEHFTCTQSHARMGFNLFLAPFGMGRDLEVATEIDGPVVTYCVDLEDGFKDVLLTRMVNVILYSNDSEST